MRKSTPLSADTIAILRCVYGVTDRIPSHTVLETLGASMHLTLLRDELERRLRITVTNKDLAGMTTVDSIETFIVTHCGAIRGSSFTGRSGSSFSHQPSSGFGDPYAPRYG